MLFANAVRRVGLAALTLGSRVVGSAMLKPYPFGWELWSHTAAAWHAALLAVELAGLAPARYGTTPDRRIFQTGRGGLIQDSACSAVWADARAKALTPAQHRSPLGRRPYDAPRRRIPADQLRRPGNRGRRAGHGVAVLLKIYAHCIDGQADAANHRITDAFSAGDALISNITDVVADEIVAWQTRPLDAFYAIIYIDALVVKVRDGGMVQNKAAYLAVGADADGFKHVLGIRLGGDEGASFWAGVLAELRNRGVKDVLFVCCDGLEGLCCAKTQHMV